MTAKAAVITVDGPGGAGKGTLCQALALALGWHLLDSGAIYRGLALAVSHQQTPVDDEQAIIPLAKNLDITFLSQNNQPVIMLAGNDVSLAIRTQQVAETASKLAAFAGVREALLMRQRDFRQPPGLVADGRDMGTVVFPDAPVKIFLDASAHERASRRMRQLQQQGFSVNFNPLLAEIQQRDERDRHRSVAPLVPASDAMVLDSTHLTIEQVIARALEYARTRLH